MKDLTWPIFNIEVDMEDLTCFVSGVKRNAMSNSEGLYAIDTTAQTIKWDLPQEFQTPQRSGPHHGSRNSGGSGHPGGTFSSR